MLRYRDFPFPLNVLLNVLTREEGRAEAMHYGFFESPGDSIARLLEVGIGLGTTLVRLLRFRGPGEHAA